MTRRLVYIVVGSLILSAVGFGVYNAVKWAYGGFGDYYYVTADLDRAGQQMEVGLDVRVRGVIVGKVSDIQLVDRHARLELQIESRYKVPKDAQGVISLKTPLGAKYMDLRYPSTGSGPYLADGDTLQDARIGPELEDALDDGVSVLDAFDPDDAATIINELADASSGRGEIVARGISANSELSNLFASTLDPQIESLDDFVTIFTELKKKGVDLNNLADAVNAGAPVYASAEAESNLHRSLVALQPFADDFADLLIYNRGDWDRMMDQGDVVLATIAARPGGLHDLVHGLYRYMYKLGADIDPFFRLADGSAGAGFTAFIGGNDEEEENNQLCDAFPPDIRKQVPACQGRRR